jgi:hypothetical protein
MLVMELTPSFYRSKVSLHWTVCCVQLITNSLIAPPSQQFSVTWEWGMVENANVRPGMVAHTYNQLFRDGDWEDCSLRSAQGKN